VLHKVKLQAGAELCALMTLMSDLWSESYAANYTYNKEQMHKIALFVLAQQTILS